jgi:hypothetical protein
MQDERNTPQEEDEEVQAHRKIWGPAEEPGRSALNEDDDEVEAHRKIWDPVERKIPKPSE